MPRIAQSLIDSSLYMYRTVAEAETGTRTGGSGFLVGQPCDHGSAEVHLYAVTNAHVVEKGGRVARAMRRDGTARIFDLRGWQVHPTGEDVAVCWIEKASVEDAHGIHWVPREWFSVPGDFGPETTRDSWPWRTGPIIAGEDTVSVARFIGFDGNERNQPSVRFGNLTSTELFSVNQRPGRDHDQRSFLVEARSLGGYSGSPVFVFRTSTYFNGGVPPVESALLLGIGWGHIKHPTDEQREYDVEIETPGLPTAGRYNSGVMAVVPAAILAELLDDPAVAATRP